MNPEFHVKQKELLEKFGPALVELRKSLYEAEKQVNKLGSRSGREQSSRGEVYPFEKQPPILLEDLPTGPWTRNILSRSTRSSVMRKDLTLFYHKKCIKKNSIRHYGTVCAFQVRKLKRKKQGSETRTRGFLNIPKKQEKTLRSGISLARTWATCQAREVVL